MLRKLLNLICLVYYAVVVLVEHGITTHFPIKMVSKRNTTKVRRYILQQIGFSRFQTVVVGVITEFLKIDLVSLPLKQRKLFIQIRNKNT